MWIKEPGKIADRIDFLGTYDMCLYLLRGKDAMIIGGGMSYVAPCLETQLSRMEFDLDRIRYLVIPHSHFDHCGAVPYLKRRFPRMEVLASAYSKEVFSKKKVVSYIADVNKRMIEKSGLQGEYERLNLQIDEIKVDRVVREKDVVDLGDGIEARFIEVPGHSRCCIGTYVPCLGAIFPTDAAPFPTGAQGELSYPSAQYDFSAYLESLSKLVAHDVQLCAFDHHGVLVGEQAKDVLRRGLVHAEQVKNDIIEQYRVTGDMDKTARKLASEILEKSDLPYMSQELMTTITKAMISGIIRKESNGSRKSSS
ncbi:MAG: MBL fold metallo-hydrolase [Chloroflexi bacterium]|nr:MBL fold metallo-hydrolase [Chloroflexota bacterium]